MSKPAHVESPVLFGFTLGGYFIGLVLLDTLGFILAPIPVAMCTLRGQHDRVWFFIAVAGLAEVMNLALGRVTLVVPMLLYAAMGILIARAVERRSPYLTLVKAVTASLLVIQFVAMSLQWTALGAQRDRTLGMLNVQLSGNAFFAPEISDSRELQLNIQVWVLEHWQDVFIGLTIATTLIGASMILGWIYRAQVRNGIEPNGSFAQFRPNEHMVWLAIVAAVLCYLNYRSPNPTLQTIGYNLAPGLIILYSLSGLAIVLHALRLWRPNPILMFMILFMILIWGGSLVTLAFLGLFDTWGDFRKRMNERVAMANDSHDDFD